MKVKVISKFLALLSFCAVFSQDLPKVMPPSPNAAALAQYANLPTNNYTGVPNIDIHLYTVKSGDVELPISLSYHASGIKVSQEASNVGLGWAFNAGGVISRSVNGVDDLKPIYGYTVVNDLPFSLSHPDLVVIDPSAEYYEAYNQINTGLRDGKPDLMYYNFLGESGKMMFDKRQVGSNLIKGIPLEQTNITFVYDVDKKEWEVTDGNGWKYYFNVMEVSRNYNAVDNYFAPSYLVNEAKRIASFDTLDHSVNYDESISAWYINKIITPQGDLITFEYDKDIQRKSISQLNFYEQESYYGNPLFDSSEYNNTWFGNFSEKKNIIGVSMSSSDNINLKKIVFKNGYINFTTSDRDDQRQAYNFGNYFPKAQKLDSFEIFDLFGKSIKKVEFNYSYFNSDKAGKNKENYWRLKLNSVQESFYDIATSTYKKNPAYTFAYNYINLPAKTSASVDHWGYYNGYDNDNIRFYEDKTRYLHSYNSFAYDYIAHPVVINYDNFSQYQKTRESFLPLQVEAGPSSGSTSYPFLDGAYREPDTVRMQAGILEKITYPTGGATKFIYEPNKYDPNSQDGDAYAYVPQQFSVWASGDEVDDASQSFYLNNYTIVKIECNVNNWGPSSQLSNIKAEIETSDGYSVIKFLPSQNNFNSFIQLVLPPGSYNLKANTNSPTGSVEMTLKIKFINQYSSDGVIGAGLRIAKQQSLDTDGSVALTSSYDYNYRLSGGTSGMAMSDIQHFYRDGGHKEYYGADGITYAYVNVIVRSSENSTPMSSSAQGNYVGYSEVSVSEEDQSGNKLGRSTYYYANNPDEEGLYHLPGMPMVVHMDNGNLLKEEHYNAKGNILKRIENQFIKNDPATKVIYGTFTKSILKTPPSGSYGTGTFISSYRVYSEWWYPGKTIETNYDQNGLNPVIVETTYGYENSLHKNLTKATSLNSLGETVETTNKYPQDMVNGFDETSTSIVSGMITKNILNPILKTETKVNGTAVQGSLTNYKMDSGIYIPLNIKSLKKGSTTDYDKRIDFTDYDESGNLLEVKQTGGTPIIYVWGYNKALPIAKIENATYETGKPNSVTSAQQLLINNAINVSNNDNSSAAEDSLRTALNQLRTGFPAAMVTAYTYDHLTGVTSTIDPKGQKNTYEYDLQGRLFRVRDAEGRVVSENKYNYKS